MERRQTETMAYTPTTRHASEKPEGAAPRQLSQLASFLRQLAIVSSYGLVCPRSGCPVCWFQQAENNL